MPNSAQFASSWLIWAAAMRVEHRQVPRRRRGRVVRGRDGLARVTDLEASRAEPREGLRAGHLVDEVEVDGQDGGRARVLGDDVVGPDLVDDRARCAHDGSVPEGPVGPAGDPSDRPETPRRSHPHPLVLAPRSTTVPVRGPIWTGITLTGAARYAGVTLIYDDQTGQEPLLSGSSSLGLVRFRLWLALVTMFAIPLAIAAPVVFGLMWRPSNSIFAPTLAIIALGFALGSLVVYLARRILEPAEQLERSRVILEDAYDRARAESLRDALTGLGNHRAFQEEFERQWLIARRHGTPLALAMIDLDDFKRVNDVGGHGAGDRCLNLFARTMHGQLRRTDREFRVGGDEFGDILMPQSDVDGAYMTIRRLLAASSKARPATTSSRPSRSRPVSARCPGPAVDRRVDVSPGRRRPVLGQAARSHVRDTVRPGHARRRHRPDRRPSWPRRSARSRRPARFRAVFQPDLRHADRSGPRLRGSHSPIAGHRVRRSGRAVRGRRGDGPDGRAGSRLPGDGPVVVRDASRYPAR